MSLARAHRAHLTGLYTKSPFAMPPAIVGRGASAVFAREMEEAAKEQEQTASAEFTAAAQAAGLSFEWVHYDGEVMDGLAVHSHCADLLVVCQTPPETLEDVLTRNRPDHVVLESACPTLIVPHGHAGAETGRRVLIAWKRTRQAARAVRDSLAVLRAAPSVTVLTVGSEAADNAAGRGIIAYLGRHGVAAESRPDYGDDSDVAAIILAHARDVSADLIVMGAYGRSHLREVILGGATEDMISRTSVPLLMSH